MKITQFSEYMNKLESTSKRLEITAILQEMLGTMDKKEVDRGIYLSLGYLKALYVSPKFNIAERMMVRILENAYKADKNEIEQKYAKAGDLGDVAYDLAPAQESELSVSEVHAKLLELAETTGTGSQESKVIKATAVLAKLDKLSAKYIVRIILGTTRLGFTELTVIDALNKRVGGNKETKEQIEMTYNLHPEIGLITSTIVNEGLKGLEKIQIETGVPIMPQRCQRLASPEEIIEKMGTVSAEYKFDGTRVQLHMDRKKEDKSTFPYGLCKRK